MAIDQDLDLFTNVVEPAQDLLVALDKGEDGVGNAGFAAKLPGEDLGLAEVVAGKSREQVVDGLELETTVDKVEPGGAVDVHGGTELALREGLGLAQVGVGRSPVGEGDLNVQRHGDNVRNQHKADAGGPVGEGLPEKTVAEEEPVATHENNLSGTDPPGLGEAETGRPVGDDVKPREEIEVEASDSHDGVVGILLVGDEEVGGGVPNKGEVVVAGVDRLEEGGGSGEEGDVLNIGVVFLRVLEMKRRQKTKTYGIVGDKVVDVVTALPPSDGETAAKVGDEHGNESVDNKVGGNGEMSTIVGGKHELMLTMLVGNI